MMYTSDLAETEVSSPPCSLKEAPSAYCGFASHDELLVVLRQVLEDLQRATRALAATCRLDPPPPPEIRAELIDAVGRAVKVSAQVRRIFRELASAAQVPHLSAAVVPAEGTVHQNLLQASENYSKAIHQLLSVRPRTRSNSLHRQMTLIAEQLSEIVSILAEASRIPERRNR